MKRADALGFYKPARWGEDFDNKISFIKKIDVLIPSDISPTGWLIKA